MPINHIRFYILNGLLLLFTSSCAQTNDFKLKGDTPDVSFKLMEPGEVGINYQDVDDFLLRNRVYVIFDSLNQITLNGHLLSMEEFRKGLSYICNNPDQLEHLPMHPDSVVICINYDPLSGLDFPNVEKAFKIKYVLHCLEGLQYQKISEHLQEKGKNWQTADISADLQAFSEQTSNRFKIAYQYFDRDNRRGVDNLPPWSEEELDISKLSARNVLEVKVDAQNKTFVDGKEVKVEALTDMVKAFIANPENDPGLAESPKKALISLRNERGTNYKAYLEVYNALKNAYDELWDELSQQKYGIPYTDDMPSAQKKAIREAIPFVISEAEPTDFGEE